MPFAGVARTWWVAPAASAHIYSRVKGVIVQDNPVVPGVDEWLDKQNPGVREALLALGALLSGRDYESGRKPPRQDAWIAEQLGVDNLTKVARVHRAVGAVDTVRVGMALAAMVTDPGTVCGPRAWSSSDLDDAVEWITAEIMSGHIYTYPAEIALATNALGDEPVVLIWRAKDRHPGLQVIAGDHAVATDAAQQLVDCARRDHDPFRGGVWRLGGGSSYQQLELHARPRPTMRREDVALAEPVWAELVPGAVDVAAVAAAAPATATGADMREWVRRCVLAEGEVSTRGLVSAAGGAPVTELTGAYL